MSEAHKLQTLQTLKNRLIKSASNVETESEMIIDALRALDEIEVNKYLINKSGLGNTLSEMRRESCKNHATIKAMITNTLKRWREIALAEQSGSSSNVAGEGTATAAASSSSVPTTAPAAKASSAFPTARAAVPQATGDPAILSENHTRKMAISSDRRTIVQVISKIFQKFMEDTAVPDRIALGIEEELNKVHHHDKAKTQYTSKAKTLSFNISKNENLRNMLISGAMPFHRLVSLSPAELASNELKEMREKIAHESNLARRADKEELYRKEIQADLGIDADQLWAYDNGDDSHSEPDADAAD